MSGAAPLRTAAVVARTPHRAIATIAIVLGTFTSVLSSTILNVPLHDIARDLRVPISEATLLVTGALIAFATLLPLGGWAGTRFGRRNTYCAAIAAIGAAGLVAALSHDLVTLVAMRIIQGAAAAAIVPSVMTMLSDLYEPERRAFALSAWAMANSLGQALGPPLGGVLASAFTWRATFVPSPVIAAITLVAALAYVPRDTPRPEPLAWRGALALTAGAFLLQTAFIAIPQLGVASPVVAALAVAGALAVVVFTRSIQREPAPFVSPRAFGEPSYRDACIAVLAVTIALGAALLAVPLELIAQRGFSTGAAGFVSFALPLAMAICAPLSSGFVRRFGTTNTTRAGLVALAGGTAALACVVALRGPIAAMGVSLLAVGAAIALAYTSTAVGATATEAGRYGAGIGLYNLLRIAGTALGAALVAAVLRYEPGGYAAAFALCACVAVAGLLATFARTRSLRITPP